MKTQASRSRPFALKTLLTLFVTALVLSVISHVNSGSAAKKETLPDHVLERFGPPPPVPEGELSAELAEAVELVFAGKQDLYSWTREQHDALNVIAKSRDPRLAWLVADVMRFAGLDGLFDLFALAARDLLQINFDDGRYWTHTTDHLIAWDIPAPPDYLRLKRSIFTAVVPEWEKIFTPGDVDWRHVSWGGVRIDDRAPGTTDTPCNCIPAADNPTVTSAEDAKWLSDDAIVFGISINGEHRAYPRRIMEVREMVNDTLGGRDLGIPYCTLCGAAQAYFTDSVPEGVERPILRTSGLLVRSNKVMYDINTYSVMDTFLGTALNGALADKQIKLPQATVITTDWGTWKKEHPTTTVLTEDLALGRDFDFRNNRDADGPIFPIGDVDPRLPVQEDIVGIVTADGTPIAFQRSAAILELTRGKSVEFENLMLELDGSGIRITNADGDDLGSHQAFWFAWSQFHPETKLWPN